MEPSFVAYPGTRSVDIRFQAEEERRYTGTITCWLGFGPFGSFAKRESQKIEMDGYVYNRIFNRTEQAFDNGHMYSEMVDIDNDGDLDMFIYSRLKRTLLLMRNDNGTFVETETGLNCIPETCIDYDHDGDLDIISNVDIYQNTLGVFTHITTSIPINSRYAEWRDFDTDGDIDCLLCGYNRDLRRRQITIIRNDEGVFTNMHPNIPEPESPGKATWGDYDNDDDLDILVFAEDSQYNWTRLYENLGNNTYQEVPSEFIPVWEGDIQWVDIDNDGYLDILVVGITDRHSPVYASKLYLNEDGLFTDADESTQEFGFTTISDSFWKGAITTGDYDMDGDLDILLSGWLELPDRTSQTVTRLYENVTDRGNTPPEIPQNPAAEVLPDNSVEFFWMESRDPETPGTHLSYNICIETIQGRMDICSPMSQQDGTRLLYGTGNTDETTSCRIVGLPAGRYFWKVQALDGIKAGSPFCDSQYLNIGNAPEYGPEINIKVADAGNNDIKNGSVFSFGRGLINEIQGQRFIIENGGDDMLLLSHYPPIMVTGDHAGDFQVEYDADPVLSSGGRQIFSINFRPRAYGTRTAYVIIPNNDYNENPYTFTVTAYVCKPDIQVDQVSNGGIMDIGDHEIIDWPAYYMLDVRNTGDAPLILTGTPRVSLGGPLSDGFTLMDQPPEVLEPSSYATVWFEFLPEREGDYEAVVEIQSNDPDENPYTFTITATAHYAPDMTITTDSTGIPNGSTYTIDSTAIGTGSGWTFMIESTGGADLNLTGEPVIHLSGDTDDFYLVRTPVHTAIVPGGSESLKIMCAPRTPGDKSITLSIENNTPRKNPYTIIPSQQAATKQ